MLLGLLLWLGVRAYQDSQRRPQLSQEQLASALQEEVPLGATSDEVEDYLAGESIEYERYTHDEAGRFLSEIEGFPEIYPEVPVSQDTSSLIVAYVTPSSRWNFEGRAISC
jgi:hypothetical protein